MIRTGLLLLLGLGMLGITSTAFAECERMYTYSYSGLPDADNFELFVPADGSRWGTIHFASDVAMKGIEFCGRIRTTSASFRTSPYPSVSMAQLTNGRWATGPSNWSERT